MQSVSGCVSRFSFSCTETSSYVFFTLSLFHSLTHSLSFSHSLKLPLQRGDSISTFEVCATSADSEPFVPPSPTNNALLMDDTDQPSSTTEQSDPHLHGNPQFGQVLFQSHFGSTTAYTWFGVDLCTSTNVFGEEFGTLYFARTLW